MSTPSLTSLAQRACIKNIALINDVGDASYDLVKPLLQKIQNPDQLYEFEQNSPQLVGQDAEIWQEFCRRDIPQYDKDPTEPTNPASWFKLYKKLYKDSQQEIAKDAELLKATMASIKNKQAQNKVQQVELKGVKIAAEFKKDQPLPQISLPKNSSMYHKERPMHLDANIVRYEREHGKLPTDPQHQRAAPRRNSEKTIPKPKSVVAKFRKDLVGNGHFSLKNKAGVMTPREMSVKQPTTKASMLTAARRAPPTLASTATKSSASIKQAVLAKTPPKRTVSDAELDEPKTGSREDSAKRLKTSANGSTPAITRLMPDASRDRPAITSKSKTEGKERVQISRKRTHGDVESEESQPSSLQNREQRLKSVKDDIHHSSTASSQRTKSANETKAPLFTATSLKIPSASPSPTPTPRRLVRVSPPLSSSQGTRSSPPLMRMKPRKPANPLMAPKRPK